MGYLKSALLLVVVAIFIAGCGGGFKTGSKWDPKESRLFDDGVDVLADMSKLSGKWEYDAENELDARTNLSDSVAIVEVMSVQTNKDLDGIESKQIDVRVEDVIYGEMPSNTFVLKAAQDSLGYSLILRHESSLVGMHIIFIRWFKDEKGALKNHFHLAPRADQIEGKVRTMAEARKDEEEAQLKTQ